MTATISLIWKEYREIRFLSLCTLAFFVGFPILEGLHRVLRSRPFGSDMGSGLVLGLGAVYALLVAIATTCTDLSHPLDRFWRSRPVPVFHSLAVKYLVGLFSVVAVTGIPVLLEMFYQFHTYPERYQYTILPFGWSFRVLMCHTPILVLIFSSSFLIGCLLRRPVETAILSSTAGLLVYFTPLLFSNLVDFSIFNMMDNHDAVTIIRNVPSYLASIPWSETWQIPLGLPGASFYLMAEAAYVKHTLVMLFLSVVLWGCAVYAVKKNRSFAMHQRGIVWALAVVALFLFGVASVQIGSNLEVDEIIEWEGKKRSIVGMARRDGKVITLSVADRLYYAGEERENLLQALNLADPTKSSSWKPPTTWVGTKPWHTYYAPHLTCPPDLPNRVYYLTDDGTTTLDFTEDRTRTVRTSLALATVDLEKEGEDAFVHDLEIFKHFPELENAHTQMPRMYYKDRKIYIAALERVLVVGLSNPDEPELLEVLKTEHWGSSFVLYRGGTEPSGDFQKEAYAGKPWYEVRLRALPGLSPRERFEASLALLGGPDSTALDGSLCLSAGRDSLQVFEVADYGDETALLVQLGKRTMTPLQRFRYNSPLQVELRNGFAYVVQGRGVSVFDFRDPSHPKRTGHYMAPREYLRCLSVLEDGRVLAGGNNLHLLTPPRDRSHR